MLVFLASDKKVLKRHIICGFTRDWTDVAEAQAARELLRDLGVRDVISYKRDSDTNKGVYDADREFIYKA